MAETTRQQRKARRPKIGLRHLAAAAAVAGAAYGTRVLLQRRQRAGSRASQRVTRRSVTRRKGMRS